jgi:cephalosporin hydroxylase
MDDDRRFRAASEASAASMSADPRMRALTDEWFVESARHRYSYNFTWMGLPIIQYPQDIMAMQELIWAVRPDLIVETGIARGGSIVFYASLLELLGGDGRIVGIDIDIRAHNREAIERHPMAQRIDLIEGSSIAPDVVDRVRRLAEDRSKIVVVLDSHHTHDHVLQELQAYSSLVRPGSYIVIFDTVIETMPADAFPDRPWDQTDNPATAVRAFLEQNDRFEVDRRIEDKLLISVAPGGYLKCVKA